FVVTAGLSAAQAPARSVYEVDLVGTARLFDAVEPVLEPGSAGVCLASIAGHGAPDVPAINAAIDAPLDPLLYERLAAAGVDLDDAMLAYFLSKLGVLRMVRRLAPAWGRRGARIVSVSPGTTDTPMARAEMAEHPIMAEMTATSPLGRIG